MNLPDAVVEVQSSLLQLYRKLEERFKENSVIQALWHDMASDVTMQIHGIQSLPASFWSQLKKIPGGDVATAIKNAPSPPEDVVGVSFQDGLDISLQIAEPLILGIYTRVVALLRENPTMPSLDFYILVKTYTARLVRTAESFAGDHQLLCRARFILTEVESTVRKIMVTESGTPSVRPQKSPVSAGADTKLLKKSAKGAKAVPTGSAPIKTNALPGKRP